MTRSLRPLVAALALAVAGLTAMPAQAQSTAITYQGELKQSGARANGDYEFRFRVFDAANNGAQLAEFLPTAPILVQDGRFTASLDLPPGAFDGSARFLQIEVRRPGETDYAMLSPRQPLTSAPGAHVARLALSAGNQSVNSASIQNGAVGALQIDDAQVQRRLISDCPPGQSIRSITSLGLAVCEVDDTGPANAWVNGGNAFGGPGVLGTTDAQPLEFRVEGARVGRISRRQLTNVLFGDPGNTIGPLATSATISGGGVASILGAGNGDNAVYDDSGTVAGGSGNTAGADDGANNDGYSSIGGGYLNTASGLMSVVSGGEANTASGEGAAVPGGFSNTAVGAHSFAAGRSANAAHNNSFVWSGLVGGFASTAPGQFVARAPGGFGFNAIPTAANQFAVDTSNFAVSASGGLRVNAATIPAGVDAVIGSRDGGNTDVWFRTPGGNVGINFGVVGSDMTNAGMYIARSDGATFYDYMLFNTAGHVDIFRNLAIHGTASTPANAWTAWSDARLKRDVQPLQGVLDRLLSLQGVTYDYRDDIDFGNYSAGRKTGFIAQEVERVFPDWVDTDAKGYRRVTIQGFEAIAVEALRELKSGSDARIDTLERDNAELRARLQRLEQLLLRDRY